MVHDFLFYMGPYRRFPFIPFITPLDSAQDFFRAYKSLYNLI